MTKTDLVTDWLDDTLAQNGLADGLCELAEWARDLTPLEREFVRLVASNVVGGFVGFPEWCPTHRERQETTRRLVDAALDD